MSGKFFVALIASFFITGAITATIGIWQMKPPSSRLSPLHRWQTQARDDFHNFCKYDPTLSRIATRIEQDLEPPLRNTERNQLRDTLQSQAINRYQLRATKSTIFTEHDWSQNARVGTLSEGQGFTIHCDRKLEAKKHIELLVMLPVPAWIKAAHNAFEKTKTANDKLFSSTQQNALVAALIAAALCAMMLPLLFRKTMLTRMRTVFDLARGVAGGSIITLDDVDPSKTAIIGNLRSDLDVMAGELNRERKGRLEIQRRALRAERIAAWRDVARMVAHEIKNPLSPIQLAMQTLRKAKANRHPEFDEIFDESTQTVLEEVHRMKDLANEFSAFARLPRPQSRDVELNAITAEVVAMHRREDLHIDCDLNEANLRGDSDQLRQVIINLMQNAIDAADPNAPVIRCSTAMDDADVYVSIEDNGEGIDENDAARIFEPYFTKKSHGTGLGLAIVQRIVHDHLGTIEVKKSELGGAKFLIRLARSGPIADIEATIRD